MTVNTTLISQDQYSITINVWGTDITFKSEGFPLWLYDNHPELFTKYIPEGKNTAFFDLVQFNQSTNAKRYYLQYLNQLISKDTDQWDKVVG